MIHYNCDFLKIFFA